MHNEMLGVFSMISLKIMCQGRALKYIFKMQARIFQLILSMTYKMTKSL